MTRSNTPGPVIGAPPSLEWIAVASLQTDPAYQRTIDSGKSRRIVNGMVKQWDWSLCQPIVVSRRNDGSLFILDGQHRHAGAVQREDIPHLPCVILTGQTLDQEAKSFVALNTARQKLSQTDIFIGMLAAGDEAAKRTAQIMSDTGWEVARHTNTASFKPGQLGCAPMLTTALRTHGEQAVRNALTALREAYPETAVRVAGTLLKSLITIYRDERLAGIDPDDFIENLSAASPNDWLDAGQDMRRQCPAYSRQESIVEALIGACQPDRLAA